MEIRRTADSIFYRTDHVPIEMTRETELPDAFWCPMHSSVRSPYVGRCPICSMDLVAIAPPRVGEYRLDVTQVSAADRRGIRGLKLQVRDPDSGEPVAMFAETHEKLLHLFIIGRDSGILRTNIRCGPTSVLSSTSIFNRARIHADCGLSARGRLSADDPPRHRHARPRVAVRRTAAARGGPHGQSRRWYTREAGGHAGERPRRGCAAIRSATP